MTTEPTLVDHWSFRAPERPKLPSSLHSDRARSPIDHFVWARLSDEGLSPSPPADRYTLIRRVSFDLTGLPPSVEEVDAFVNDQAPDAHEKLVDRLLASPRYGERWALWWLDLARYADSNGYESDRTRSIWPWRDWVIRALNDDMPFDQFTIEQIAGDMLPNASVSQQVATGFHRNTWINEEGGHDWEQFRYESVVDRVHTTATVFLGLTMACAQCHDHKYDAISQQEYWQFFALLNNADEPDLHVPDSEVRNLQMEIDAEIDRRISARAAHFPPLSLAEEQLADLSKGESRRKHLNEKFRAWRRDPPTKAIAWSPLKPIAAVSEGKATLTELDDNSILVTGDRPEVDTYEIVFETDATRVTGFRLEAIPDARLPNFGPGRGSFNGDGAFVVTEFRADVLPNSNSGNSSQHIRFSRAYANYQSGEHAIGNSIDGNKLTSWFIGGAAGKRHVAVFETDRPYEIAAGTRIRVTILQNFVHQQTLGRFRLFVTGEKPPLHSDPRPTEIDELLLRDATSLAAAPRKTILDYFLSTTPELKDYNEQIQQLRDSRPRFPTTFVFKERLQKDKRATHIHERGEYQRPDEPVSAGVPAVLHPFPEDAPRNRLTLAKWLVDHRNPLVGRVIANQLWQSFFGRGLVSTPENFGVEGALPSHPDLLDWLAVELMKEDWSLKSLQRQIVLSAVYRQSSKIPAEHAQADPKNILLARGPRFRLDAELIRDLAMHTSGLMVDTVGGPSVFPPQPSEAGSTFGPFKWKNSTGADRHRRGLYTFRKRGGPYAAFATFDTPPPNTCAMSRRRSNTPLQALAQLNDIVVMEASRSLASRVLSESAKDTRERVLYAFRLVLTRPPSETELTSLVDFYERQYHRFATGSLNSEIVCGSHADTDATKSHSLAAMTTLGRLLYNLHETIMKE